MRRGVEFAWSDLAFTLRFIKETEGEAPSIRAAKALDKTLRNMTIYILDEKLIVGNKSSELVRAVLPIEQEYISKELNLDYEMWERYNFTEEQKRELEEIMSYWDDKSIMGVKTDLMRNSGTLSVELTGLNLSDLKLPTQVQDSIVVHIEDVGVMLDLLSTTTPYGCSNIFDDQRGIWSWGIKTP